MKQTNDSLESILYNIIEELSKLDAPIIFKGALALKNLLYIDNPNLEINRKTSDIDANWIEEYNEEKITKLIEKAVKNVNSNYSVILYREPEKNISMGINILDEDNHILSKIDMDIKDNPFYVVATQNINKNDIDKVLKYEGKKLGDFKTLLENKEQAKHGYDAL